jgi:outer membrane lipoprotein SlyB
VLKRSGQNYPMIFTRVGLTGFAGLMLAFGAGCTTKSSLPVYSTGQTGTPLTVQRGRVVAVRDVIIKPPTSASSGVGPGAQVGAAVVTSVITGGTHALGNVIGNVVGGPLGGKLDEKIGEEITIEVEGGRTIVVVQERDGPPLAPDERVIIQTGGTTTTGGMGGIYGGIYGGGIFGGGGGGNTRVLRDNQFAGDTPMPDRPSRIASRR